MGAEFCQRLFLHLLKLSYGFIFQFVNMVYYVAWFAYTEEFLHFWNKPNLIKVCELLDVLLNCLCLNFLRIFESMFINDIHL